MNLYQYLLIKINELFHFCYDLYSDARFGLKTTKNVPLHEMHVPATTKKNARKYQGTPYKILHKIMSFCRDHYPHHDFIDIGSGKGRSLFMAASYGRKNVGGIEFSKKLCEIAKKNSKSFSSRFPQLKTWPNLWHADATTFDYPDTPTLYFLFNPFDTYILNIVLDKILKDNHQDNIVIYVNPIRSHVLEKKGFQCFKHHRHINHNFEVKYFRKNSQRLDEKALYALQKIKVK